MDDTKDLKFANFTAKNNTSSTKSLRLASSSEEQPSNDDQFASNVTDSHDILMEGSSYTQTPNITLRRKKLPLISHTKLLNNKSNKSSLRQINRHREKWTSAVLLVLWVFLISSLLCDVKFSIFCGNIAHWL